MRCLPLARATILTRVTGFGENIIPFLSFKTGRDFFGVWPQPVLYFGENRGLTYDFLDGYFH
jgi:hypothetical protein